MEVYEWYILHLYVLFQSQTFYGWLYNTLRLYIVPLNRITKFLTESFIHKEKKKKRALMQGLNRGSDSVIQGECWQKWSSIQEEETKL